MSETQQYDEELMQFLIADNKGDGVAAKREYDEILASELYNDDGPTDDSDAGIGKFMSDALAGAIIFDPAENMWYGEISNMWYRQSPGWALSTMHETSRTLAQLRAEGRKPTEPARKGVGVVNLNALDSNQKARSVLEAIGSDPKIEARPNMWDADPHLLGTPNGVVDLRTGQLIEVAPTSYIRRRTAVPWVAMTPETWPTKFIEATRLILPDEEVWRYVMRALGYAMTGLTGEQVWFFLHGSGGNGKTFLAEVVRRILGPSEASGYAYSGKSDTFTTGRNKTPINFGSAMNAMRGARLVIVPEISHGELDTDLMKQLTGGEPVTYRAPYGRYDVTYTPSAHLIMYGNQRPTITDSSHGNWRRLLEVPFNVRVDDKVKPIKDYWLKLVAEEGPGIQRFLIEAAAAYLGAEVNDSELQEARGPAGLLPTPKAITDATTEYRESSDPFAMWMKERTKLITFAAVPDASNRGKGLFTSYASWCDDNRAQAMGSKTFYDRLASMAGIVRREGSAGTHYLGIALDMGED